MRGLLLTHDFPPDLPGGISTYYHQLCRCLPDVLSVLAPTSPNSAEFDAEQPFRVHRCSVPLVPPAFMRERGVGPRRWPRMAWVATRQMISLYRHARKVLEEEGADVLLIGHLYLAPLGPLLRRRTSAPYGVMLHGSELHRYMGWPPVRGAMLWALNAADFLVVNSEFTRRQYLERGVRRDHRFLRLNPGVDAHRFRPDAGHPRRVRDLHGLGDRRVLLSVARLVEWKGQDVVLRALPRILGAVPETVYVMVGDGPYREDLERLVRQLGLERHVVFAGFVPGEDLPSYYRAADVMVMPSREFAGNLPVEGFGISFVEASASGVPVIGGRGGGTEESIADGVTGVRVDPHQPAEVADAVIGILQDPTWAARLRETGPAWARHFEWSAQARRLSEFLREMLEGRPDLVPASGTGRR